MSEVDKINNASMFCLAHESMPILWYGHLVIFRKVSCDRACNLKVSALSALLFASAPSTAAKRIMKMPVAFSWFGNINF